MKKESRFQNILRGIHHFFVIFLLIAFVITCCMMLFVSTLSQAIGITLTNDHIKTAAKLTFGNVVFLSLLFTVADFIRKKWMIDRPIRSITNAAQKMMQGDFRVRIPSPKRFDTDETFYEIIDCFNKMAEELGSVETLRTDFIANVSHEMKTPLAVLQNFGTLLQTPELSDKERMEYAKGITDGCRRMADMVTNILNLSRLENQQLYSQSHEYDLGEQLCECLLQYEKVWESSQIQLETDIAENVKVKADPELLALVWNNLFSNAFKFTSARGTVSVTLRDTGPSATVIVKDTGCGMTPEVGSHIFEKFYQGDPSHSVQGNGLGLALVKRVMDIIQGEMVVESIVGKGSTFTVTIQKGIS